MSKLNMTVYLTTPIHPFLSRFIACNFSSVPIVFHQFFIWIVVGDVDLRFSAIAVDEETKGAARLYHQCNHSMQLTDAVSDVSFC
jgi:hypothetical protein